MATTPPNTTAAQKAADTRKSNAEQRSATAKKAATARKTNATKRSTSAKKAAATRHRTTAAKQAAQARQDVKTPVRRAGEMAEKAVLVPVGAALVARDEVIATIDELRTSYSTRTKAEAQLRRYERRGTSAVKGIERDVKKSRTRIERELRQRRVRLERELKRNRTRIERELKSVIKDIESRAGVKNVELVGARVENAVATGRNAATKVQERITALA
ncbi:MAG: hypothetical protein M3401_10815 [Actinomycetota bacterium]|nr:hypothetical protein [Actinomycetota bacterium]